MYEIEIAKDLINKQNFNEAIMLLKKIIRKNNKDADAFFELGKVFFIKKDFKKAIVNFKKSINIKESFYSNFLLAKSFRNIENYRESLRIFFKIKKSSFEVMENIDVEIVNSFLLLKKYLYAYKYFDKYNLKNLSLQKQIIYNLFNTKKFFDNRELLKKIESFVYKFLKSKDAFDKDVVEQQLLELDKKNILIQKNRFYKYILCKVKETNDIEKMKHYNSILNSLEMKRENIKLFSKPVSLIVTLTNACNIKCDFCGIRKAQLWNLSRKKIDEIIKLMPYLKYAGWLGGEIFLYKDFEKLFDIAVKNNVFQEIVTNGLLLNKNLINKFIQVPMKLSISVTSANKKNYEVLHKGASFKKLLSNLNIIKNNIEKRHENFSYWMYVCVMKENITELENIIDLAHKYKFDTVRFQPLDKLNFEFYNRDIVKYFVYKALLKAERYNIKINNILPINFDGYKKIIMRKNKIKEEISKLFVNEVKFGYKIKSDQILDKIKSVRKENLNQKEEVFEQKEEVFGKRKVNNIFLINKKILFCEHPWTTMIINYGGEITFDCSCPVNKLDTVNNKSLLSAWNSPKVQLFREKIKKKQVYDICNYNCIAYNIHRN